MNFFSLQKRFMNFRGYQRAPNEKKNLLEDKVSSV